MSGKESIYIGRNIKFLRKQKDLTQQQLADQLGIKRSLIGAYEEGRAQPRYDTLRNLSDFFEMSLENLISEDLNGLSTDELEMYRKNRLMDVEGKKMRVLTTTVDNSDRENIEMVVGQPARAGYLAGFQDTEFISDLPKFQLPLPMMRNGTYRAFEIEGDSMLPLKPGTIIIGEYIQNFKEVKEGHTYIILSQSDGLVYKRCYHRTSAKGQPSLLLQSDNPIYSAYHIDLEDIREIWKAKAYIGMDFPDPDLSIERLSAIVLELQQEVIRINRKTR